MYQKIPSNSGLSKIEVHLPLIWDILAGGNAGLVDSHRQQAGLHCKFPGPRVCLLSSAHTPNQRYIYCFVNVDIKMIY